MSSRQKLFRTTCAALISALLFDLCPTAPRVYAYQVVKTQAKEITHATRVDFASGTMNGTESVGGDSQPAIIADTSAAGEKSFTSEIADADFVFSSIGLRWTHDSPPGTAISMYLRTSGDNRLWSDWRRVGVEALGQEPTEQETFGTLVHEEAGRFFQYRAIFHTSGGISPLLRAVQITLLNSANGVSETKYGVELGRKGAAVAGTAADPIAVVKPLNLVSRRDWGADESLRFEIAKEGRQETWRREYALTTKVIVHHTGGSNVCASDKLYCQRRSVIAMNDTYYYHTVTLGLGDIGYNAIIGYDGRIYEGRHSRDDKYDTDPLGDSIVAGHAYHYNYGTHGIALMGNFDEIPVPKHMYDSLVALISWVLQSQIVGTGRVDPLGYSDFHRSDGKVHPRLPNVLGHGDVYATSCPGQYLSDLLPSIRREVAAQMVWPPIHVDMRAHVGGDTVTFGILVFNHGTLDIDSLEVKGTVPERTTFVDSWAGAPYSNRGVFDGRDVGWCDPEAVLKAGGWRGSYAYRVKVPPGVDPYRVSAHAWVRFRYPVAGEAVSVQVVAVVPDSIVVDNLDQAQVEFRGNWPRSRSVAGYHGDYYQWNEPGDGSDTFTWKPALPVAGKYEVFAWWSAAWDRATNAPYTIYAKDGPVTIRVSQNKNGGRWVSLGTYEFGAGTTRIVLSDDADGYVIANAVRLVKR